jgi:hypothetical protein
MTAVTEKSRKEITSLLGVEIVKLDAIADAYTFVSKFGTIKGVFFTPVYMVGGTVGQPFPFVTISAVASTITFTVSGTTAAGYLMVWGE